VLKQEVHVLTCTLPTLIRLIHNKHVIFLISLPTADQQPITLPHRACLCACFQFLVGWRCWVMAAYTSQERYFGGLQISSQSLRAVCVKSSSRLEW